MKRGPYERMDHRHGILRKYPVFTAMIAGIFLLMFMHNIVCTYMIRIVEAVGGGCGCRHAYYLYLRQKERRMT